jgi:hypothetical protein
VAQAKLKNLCEEKNVQVQIVEEQRERRERQNGENGANSEKVRK